MSRPRIGRPIAVRLPSALTADLDRIAADSGMTRAAVIRLALEETIGKGEEAVPA